MKYWIQTYNRKSFDYNNIRDNKIDLDEVATSLAGQSRYLAHTSYYRRRWYNLWRLQKEPVHYSTAQHSVLISRVVPPEYAFDGLWHDAHESVMGDLPSPMKPLIDGYKDLESRVEAFFRQEVWLPSKMNPIIKEYDVRICLNEARDLMDGGFIGPVVADKYCLIPNLVIKPWSAKKAKKEFIKRFNELFPEHYTRALKGY